MLTLIQNIPSLATLAKPKTIITAKERNEIITENIAKKESLPLLIISFSDISLYSWSDMKAISVVDISNAGITGPNSINDPRMGVLTENTACEYCGDIDCPGHFGLIKFINCRIKIYNPAFIRNVISVLKCICNDCGGLLVTEETMRKQGFLKLQHDKRLAALEKYCTDLSCIHKKVNNKTCNKNPEFITKDLLDDGVIKMKTLPKGSKTKGEKDPGEAIPIEKIDKILNSISDNDARLLGFTETTEEMIERGVPEDIANIRGLYMTSHPRDMIMYGMLIPPLIARAPRYINGKLFYR